jgi:hypothetical protein
MTDAGGAMTNQRPEYLVPALIAGVGAGILSGIPFVNCLCCLWIIGGAVLAAHLLAKNSPGPLTAGDGAIVGTLTGIVAAVVDSLMSLPLRRVNEEFLRRVTDSLSQFANQMPSWWQDFVQRRATAGVSPAMFLLGLFISAAIFAVLGVLGGVIGVSVFGRKRIPPPPLPPQGPPHATV